MVDYPHPCPNCGSTWLMLDADKMYEWVVCIKCKFRGPECHDVSLNYCIENWNEKVERLTGPIPWYELTRREK